MNNAQGCRALCRAVLVVVGTAALPATAAGPVQVGPMVNVTASRAAAQTPSESTYVDTIHAQLQRASRYPTGREASLERPSGTASVWAEVARDGRVKARGVEQSSGSPLLDGMARELVGRTRFPAFAAGDWRGAPTHRFVVGYRFDGVAMTAGRSTKVAAQ